jgi:membrane protein DedA with SNARE-associated domain
MAEWVQEILVDGGATVLFALILAENLLPPIPSEAILPLAGFMVAKGELGVVAALTASTAGSVAGALLLYAIGRYGGRPLLLRHGRILRLTDERIDRAEAWFDRYGAKLVFFGRMLPGVRSVVSVPAGLAEMPLSSFVALTLAGSTIWNVALIGAGWALGDNWEQVTLVVEQTDLLLIAAAVMAVGTFAVARLRRRQRSET